MTPEVPMKVELNNPEPYETRHDFGCRGSLRSKVWGSLREGVWAAQLCQAEAFREILRGS